MNRVLSHRRDLDGLRAVAVIPVVLFHLGISHFQGGYVGVDVFFVLSGFFITRQIIADLEAGQFSILGFYDRRIRRLLPALFAMLFLTSLLAAFILLPDDMKGFGRSLVAATLSISNFYFLRQSEYFAPDAETMPLLHTWSLSVEEQFYVLFPAILFVLWRYLRTQIPLLLALLLIASFGLSVWGTQSHPQATFYLLPTRAWELLLGSLLAVAPKTSAATRPAIRNVATLAGLAMIGVAVFTFKSDMPFPGISALLPCLGCALIIWSGDTHDGDSSAALGRPYLLSWLLSLSPLVFIGLISYSLYLWHWPIIVFFNYTANDQLGLTEYLAALLVMLAAAYVSWRFVESPLRRGDVVWATRRERFSYSAGVVLLFVLFGAALDRADGFRQLQRPEVAAMLNNAKDVSPLRDACHFSQEEQGRRRLSEACSFGPDAGMPLVLFGDSHGVEIGYVLSQMAKSDQFRFRQVTASGCPPSLDVAFPKSGGCAAHNEQILNELSRAGPAVVVIAARYFKWGAPESSARETFWPGLERVVARLKQSGNQVILLGGIPTHPHGSLPHALAKRLKRGASVENYAFAVDQPLSKEIDLELRTLAAKYSSTYVALHRVVCGSHKECQGLQDGHTIYFDDNHLTVTAARRVAEILVPIARDVYGHPAEAEIVNPAPPL